MRRDLFSLLVLVTLGLAVFIGLILVQPGLLRALEGRDTAGQVMHHFREHQHRIHDLTFSFVLGTTVVGMLVQLRRPARKAAAQVMAVIPVVALLLAAALTNAAVVQFPWVALGALTVPAAVLHPTLPGLIRSFSVARVDRPMLVLVVIAAVPLLALASTNLALQSAGPTAHAAQGHYGYMAAFSFTVIGIGLLSSLRPDGWRPTAWVAGALPVLLGLASLVFPDVDSRLAVPWALAAVAWGAAFIAAAGSVGRGGRVGRSAIRQ